MTYALDVLDLPRDPALARAMGGGKAANLAVMARDLRLPVPPAFVLTTETCRTYLAHGWPPELDSELRKRMAQLETRVGRRYGDPADPLLVSVRSGAPVSMPGMMDTILNLGLDQATVAGLAAAAGDAEFARSCHERLEASFRSVVGIDLPDDPWRQLRLAIEAVFRSWQSSRAQTYRLREGIADDLGTAVTIQAMVFGNRGTDSATGVLFTRDPATGAPTLFGDVLFDAQGEDVVAGTHATRPIAYLDERLPRVASELRVAADQLERHAADLCDIEFTIEEGRLWLLQTRVGKRSPGAALRMAVDMAEDPSFPLDRAQAVRRVADILADPPLVTEVDARGMRPLASGLGASPGIGRGPVALTPAAAIAASEAGTPAILVRPTTSPDDVHGMTVAAGILTASGGLASHAAVVARGWGIPAVVGATALRIEDGAAFFDVRRIVAGEWLTIDGVTGDVFDGEIAIASSAPPEMAILRGWAADAGIAIHDPEPASSSGLVAQDAAGHVEVQPARGSEPAPDHSSPDIDELLLAIEIKGLATLSGLASALGTGEDEVRGPVEGLIGDGLLALTAGAVRLTEAGSAQTALVRESERGAWTPESAVAALDAFIHVDHRLKSVVTAWQVRDEANGVLNDHQDGDYDRAVLARLGAVHADAHGWFEGTAGGPTRLAAYRDRLDRAIAAIHAGDGRFVASPRVDSYHGIWFELHEDLIRIAGRTREEEVAAGRA